MSSEEDGPLAGIRVLCLAENLPGPYATLLLSDMGADVVMIERPDGGDMLRKVPALFGAMTRGKRSIAIDLKSDGGREDLLELARECDVVVEGFRPGTLDRLGVGYNAMKAVNPDVVYVAISGYGQDGPYRDRPGHDINYQAAAGMLNGAIPTTFYADFSSGTFAAMAVGAALTRRERTGSGSYVDVSMLDGLVSWQTPLLAMQATQDPVSAPGYRIPIDFPGHGIYRTSDGTDFSLAVTFEDHLWHDLTVACSLDELKHVGSDERIRRAVELDKNIRDSISARPASHWEAAFEGGNIPFSILRTSTTLPDDPQVVARRLVQGGSVRLPVVFDGSITDTDQPVPRLNQHAGDSW